MISLTLAWPKLRSRFKHSWHLSLFPPRISKTMCQAAAVSSFDGLHWTLDCWLLVEAIFCLWAMISRAGRIYFGFLVRLPCDTKTSDFLSKHTPSQPQVNLFDGHASPQTPVHPRLDQPTTLWTFMSQSSSPIAPIACLVAFPPTPSLPRLG